MSNEINIFDKINKFQSNLCIRKLLSRIHSNRLSNREKALLIRYLGHLDREWEAILMKLREASPGSLDLLYLLVILGDMPKSFLSENAQAMPDPLTSLLRDEMQLNATIASMKSYSLIDFIGDKLVVDKMAQEIMQWTWDSNDRQMWTEIAKQLINVAYNKYPLLYWNKWGWIHYTNGNCSKAIHCYDMALKLDPGNAEAQHSRSLAQRMLDHYNDMETAFDNPELGLYEPKR